MFSYDRDSTQCIYDCLTILELISLRHVSKYTITQNDIIKRFTKRLGYSVDDSFRKKKKIIIFYEW